MTWIRWLIDPAIGGLLGALGVAAVEAALPSRRSRTYYLEITAFTAFLGIAAAVVLSYCTSQILIAAPPWASVRHTSESYWMPPIQDWVPLASFVIASCVSLLMWRRFSSSHPSFGVVRSVAVISVIGGCAAAGSLSFGQAIAVPNGVYPTPPMMYAYAGPATQSFRVDLTVLNDDQDPVAYPFGSVQARITMSGKPGQVLQYMLLGNGYFKESPLAPQEGVDAHDVNDASFALGSPDHGECRVDPGTHAQNWMDAFRRIQGSIRLDQHGQGVAALDFTAGLKSNVLFANSSSVHLPRLQISPVASSMCFHGSSTDLFAPPLYSGGVNLLYRDPGPGSAILSVGGNSAFDRRSGFTAADLQWNSSGQAFTDDKTSHFFGISPSYEVSTQQTVARSQSYLFLAALFWGLVLAGLFEVIVSWPPRAESEAFGRPADAIRGISKRGRPPQASWRMRATNGPRTAPEESIRGRDSGTTPGTVE